MKVKYLSTLAVVSILGFGAIAGCANPCAAKTKTNETEATEEVNPCASKTNPCASKANPCASKENPCAGKTTSQAVPEGSFFVEDGVAIRGTDPVAYFLENQPVAGSPAFAYEWGGATWHFASAENRDRFAADPTAYAPQYGGYCAWAVAQGYTAPIDPNAWQIVDGKLYLNFNRRIQQKWEKDIPGNVAKADKNWPGVLS
jgi:YHS domain-containing protein